MVLVVNHATLLVLANMSAQLLLLVHLKVRVYCKYRHSCLCKQTSPCIYGNLTQQRLTVIKMASSYSIATATVHVLPES